VQAEEAELALKRPNLTMDELCELKDRGVVLEKHLHRYMLWMFSIKGYRGLQYVNGALFAGNSIVVRAPTYEQALRLARKGLEFTIEKALEFLKLSAAETTIASPITEAFGRRAGPGDHNPWVHPYLEALLRHKLGGEPWRY